ncbi:MAG: lamin tail domain-containing protein [Verrucomicrobiota bacterium]
MTAFRASFSLASLLLLQAFTPGAAHAGAFAAGNIAVLQADASASNTTASIVELHPSNAAQTPTNVIAIGGTGASALRFSGSATSTGYMANSADGTRLTFTGVNNTNTSSNVNTLNPRAVGVLDPAGAFTLPTTYTGGSGDQTRCATSLNNTAWWIADQGGAFTNGSTSASPAGNFRGIKAFGGTVYVAQASSTSTITQVATLSAITGGTVTGLAGITNNASLQDFYLISSGSNGAAFDVLYTLSATGNTAGTIAKYSLVGGSWTANGTYTTSFGGFGLAAADDGVGAVLYVTTGQGALTANSALRIADAAGHNAALSITPANNVTLYTAPAGKIIKGVAFAPAAAVVPQAQLILTEINSNAAGGDFWELTNVGNAPQDMSDWKWIDGGQSLPAPAVQTFAPGTSIAAGETVVIITDTTVSTTFLGAWGPLTGVQKFVGGPGLGMNDSVRLYDNNDTLVFHFTYASGGFTQSGGSAAAGGHAGASAGGTATHSAVIDPTFGTDAGRRYKAAAAGVNGGYANTTGGSNIGSPGVTGIVVGGGPSITLTLGAAPSSFSESGANPASTGTVTRTGATTAALVVSLSSSDTTEATVPASVTIPIGSASTTFNITAVNDSFPDGSKPVTISATASDATAGTTSVTVQDDGDVAQNNLMLTEVLSQQAATGVSDFWELTNISGSAVSLVGYSWHDMGRSAAAASTYALPLGSSIAPGESVIFTTITPAAFRAWWGIANSVQVFQTVGAPGLGQDDGVSFFDEGGNEIFFFSYAAAGFIKADGNPSTGTHSGPSAGAPTETQSTVWVPSSGTTAPRYTFATVNNLGGFASSANAADIGSPGVTSGNPTVSIGNASVLEGNSGTSTLALNVTRSDTATVFTVNYAVTGGTATSGTDYATLANGMLTFTAGGAATLPINITVNGDTSSEPDETIIITLSNVVNTTGTTGISNAAGTGTITNDDTIGPQITTQPVGTSIASGFSTTLSLVATGTPAPSIQWYQGSTGTITTPVGTNSSSFTTPALTTTTSYWARVANTGGSVDSNTATVTVTAGPTSVDLTNYVRVARINLPEYRRTALPPGTAAHNLLCDEASGVAYNWDTDTLFICGDGGRAITQVTKSGQLVDTMSLALNAANPQGTEFYDPEGITYIGGGQFVFTEERERRIVKFTYAAGTTLTRAAAQTVDLGTFDDNTGTEGLSYDPQTSGTQPGFIVLKEKTPIGVFQTNVDFVAGTATNGSPTSANSTNLFDTTLLGMTDVADVFAFSNLPSMVGQPQAGNMLIIGQEDARILNVSRTGAILSSLQITSDVGNPLSAGNQQHEGITMDRAGIIYVVNENGGGSIEFPQLWVYAPATATNAAPTAVVLNNAVNSLQENTSTASPIKIGDIVVTDDGLGMNTLSLTGADVAAFEIAGGSLYLKSGVVLDFETKTSYAVTIQADDTTVGTTPDATLSVTLTITDQVVEAPPAPALVVTEVSPWSSTPANSPLGADWFEVTNVSATAVNVTGWKVDDSSPTFASAVPLVGITSIAPGESVIFVEGTAATATSLKNNWFGANPPPGLQVGSYTGSGIGLSTSGDAVTLFTAGGVLHSGVTFGAADAASPWQTFDNTLAQYNTAISLLSVAGVNGAFIAANSPNEIGSPGYSAPGVLRVTEVAPWSSGNSPVGADWFEVTNIGARPVDVTGWKVDDSSESPAAAVPLAGVTSIAPGESVIFLETATLAATRTAFLNNWFGASPPVNLQVGSYAGDGIGLSSGSDAVNLYDTNGVRRAKVFFSTAPSSAPFGSFDNSVAGENVSVSLLSALGTNGAFAAANSAIEIGSPGLRQVTGPMSFPSWLAQNGYTGTLGGDTDNDDIPDQLEYFFSTNPNSGSDRAGLPQVAMNGSDLEFTFTYLTATTSAGFIQSSENLVNWVNATAGVDYEIITQTVNGPETTVRFRLFCNPTPTAQGPFTYLTPFTADVERGTIGSLTITNLGMVGAGRLTGSQLDGFGETMGASSGLSITGWGYNAGSGQFSGVFNVLPDRGYNSGAIFSNYAARVHSVPFTFTPYYGSTAVGQTQIVPTYSTTTKFTYLDNLTTKFTTGLNPTGVSTIMGQSVGTVVAANGPGGAQESLISFDAEAIHVFPDGSGFVSDEYGTYICRFNASKQITKFIQLPESARPHRPVGTLEFDSINPPTNGRRNNQGLEGMAVTPDNTRLLALMQSALVQDTGAGGQGRYNTRLYVYDIAGANLENPVLISEHAVQLPRYDLNGNGSGLDTTSAQSEIVALSNTQFLMLPRDGNGLGKGTTDPIVMKTVDLVDFASATNILNLHDAEGAQISPTGTLRTSITPAKSTVVINLLSTADLTKFGFNTNTSAPNQFTVNEKMEGMSLVPDTSTTSTDDYFLFLGNDNDFQSSDVKMIDASGALVSYGDARDRGITNDAVFTAWRIIITPNNRKFFRVNVNP